MPIKKETIHFVITGGTIDSYYDGSKDTVIPNKKSVIPNFVKNLKLYSKTIFTEVCMKDSRDLGQSDLKNILNAIEKSSHRKIIVTHGTYTMPDTSRYLKARLKDNKKTIILTGSMIPLMGFSPSDAPFNLGFAIAKLQDLQPGIYVCMNGKVFESSEVTKIISEGRFVSVFG
jgi:L-asparaginase